jgi:hypothetical protein
MESEMRQLRWIAWAVILGTGACSGSSKRATADSGVVNADSSGGAAGAGGSGATGGVVAAGGTTATYDSSVDAPSSDVSTIRDMSPSEREDIVDASIVADGAGTLGDGAGTSIGESYVACLYVGGEDFVAVVKQDHDVCVLLAVATPVSSPKNLGLKLPGRWGLRTAAVWPQSSHPCTGSSAPAGAAQVIGGSGTADFTVQGANIIMDLDLVLQFPSGDAAPVSYSMKVTGLETTSRCS